RSLGDGGTERRGAGAVGGANREIADDGGHTLGKLGPRRRRHHHPSCGGGGCWDVAAAEVKERRAVVLLVGGTLIAPRFVGQVQLGVSHHRRDERWALVPAALVSVALVLVLVLVVRGACLLVVVGVVSVHDGVAEIPQRLGGPWEERHHQQEDQGPHLLSLT